MGGSSATPFAPDSLDVRRKHAPEVFGDISQLRSQRHVRGCRSGQVEFVVWLAQMVAVMPSIFGDQTRIRTGRMWRWCKMEPPPRRVRANHSALRPCRPRLLSLTLGG